MQPRVLSVNARSRGSLDRPGPRSMRSPAPDSWTRILAVIYAERPESEIRVQLSGAGERIDLGPGLCKLPLDRAFTDKTRGCIGSWGFQETVIGEICMGLIVPPETVISIAEEKTERCIRCRAENNSFRYWIVGDWRRGRLHPVAPTIDNWHGEMKTLASRLLRPVRITLENPEDTR